MTDASKATAHYRPAEEIAADLMSGKLRIPQAPCWPAHSEHANHRELIRLLPDRERLQWWEFRNALFNTGQLTGDEADEWAWKILRRNASGQR